MMQGIFVATSKMEPDKKFIFSSPDGEKIWNIHFEMMLKGKHPNKKLQDHLKQNPTDEFELRLLFACGKNEMVHYTQHFINKMDPFFNSKKKTKK